MSLINLIWVYGGLALATAVCGGTFWWGGPAERICAATLWIAWVLSLILFVPGPKGPGTPIMIIDTICLIVFVVLSVKTRQLWTLFVAACQLDDVMSHFAAQLSHFQLYSYVVATGLWGGHFILVCLVVATIGYRLRLKRQANLQTA